MRKFICSLLIFAITLNICALFVSAAPSSATLTVPGDSTSDIRASYNASATLQTVYNVDLFWGAMDFTYNISGSNVWDSSKHIYEQRTTADWTASGNEITVVNHSNADIKAEFSFKEGTNFAGIAGKFSKPVITLPSAVYKALDAPELTDTTYLTLSGELSDMAATKISVGVVTVTLS